MSAPTTCSLPIFPSESIWRFTWATVPSASQMATASLVTSTSRATSLNSSLCMRSMRSLPPTRHGAGALIARPRAIDSKKPKPRRVWVLFTWCRRRDLNPHDQNRSLAPQASASANSATPTFATGSILTWIPPTVQVFFPKKLEIFFQTPLHQLRGKKIDLSGGVDGRSGNAVGRDLGICRVRERDEGQALPRHG